MNTSRTLFRKITELYKNSYENLNDTFNTDCGTKCKVIYEIQRIKKFYKNKELDEWENRMILPVKCKYGHGDVHCYECNSLFVDPSEMDDELMKNYQIK